jgi:hypothetical protein
MNDPVTAVELAGFFGVSNLRRDGNPKRIEGRTVILSERCAPSFISTSPQGAQFLESTAQASTRRL